jgi:glutamate-1-semialdehyde 2,1-aminomutase
LESVEKYFKLYPNLIACVVLEPYVFSEPENYFLQDIIKLAHRNGALVLFDEVVTGIRWDKFSVQNSYGVKPDLTALGKTLGNGFPISCIGGRRNIMKVLDGDCFVSTTFGGELASIVSAIATLRVAVDSNLPEALYESGMMVMEGFNHYANSIGLDCKCVGTPYRQKLEFPTPEHKALFWQECVLHGVLLGGAQHTTLAHTDPIISRTLNVFKNSLITLKENWSNPKDSLLGKLPQQVIAIQEARK